MNHPGDRTNGGVVEEGLDDAEEDVRELVLAAVDVLAKTGANVSKVQIPAHHAIRAAQPPSPSAASEQMSTRALIGVIMPGSEFASRALTH